jgi:hypothetical protein
VRRRERQNAFEQRWATACDDARYLAVELAAGYPLHPIDVVALGLVLEPGETAFRYLPAAISQHDPLTASWSTPASVWVLLTDRRALIRLVHGPVVSLWWNGLQSVDLNWPTGRVVLDYGDGMPRAISGPFVADFAVAITARAYCLQTLTTHPALERLRARD